MENESKNSSSDNAESSLLRKYYKHLATLGIQTIERGTRLQHIKWMCLMAQGFEDPRKMNRWLGWIQCALDCEGIYSLNESMEHTREEMRKYDGTK